MTRKFPSAPPRLACLLFATGFLFSCDTYLGVNLSGASSMRVEVEVYKGPLSKDPWTQYGELMGLMSAVRWSFVEVLDFTEKYSTLRRCQDTIGIVKRPKGDDLVELVKALRRDDSRGDERYDSQSVTRIVKWKEFLEDPHRACLVYWNLLDDLRFIVRDTANLHEVLNEFSPRTGKTIEAIGKSRHVTPDNVRDRLSRVAFTATWLKTKALFWQGIYISSRPEDDFLRNAMVNFSALAAEYSNQMGSRADMLLLQMNDVDRRELPLSVHLRDTKPTDFMSLYVWNQGALSGVLVPPKEGLQEPWYKPGPETYENAADRVRIMERLYADHYWSKINTVYASGQGDVAMAFIKDEIGNWNLKSFDNDPTELLQAYSKVAQAALKAAAELATPGAAGVSQSMKLLDLANRVSTGRGSLTAPATAGGFDIDELHKRALRSLLALQKKVEAERAKLDKEVETAKEGVTKVQNGTPEEKDKAAKAVQAANDKRDKAAVDAMRETAAILNMHAEIVDILMEGASKGAAGKAAAGNGSTGALQAIPVAAPRLPSLPQ